MKYIPPTPCFLGIGAAIALLLRRQRRLRQQSPKKEQPTLPSALLAKGSSLPSPGEKAEEGLSSSIRQPLTSPELRLSRSSHLVRNSAASATSGMFTREEAISQ